MASPCGWCNPFTFSFENVIRHYIILTPFKGRCGKLIANAPWVCFFSFFDVGFLWPIWISSTRWATKDSLCGHLSSLLPISTLRGLYYSLEGVRHPYTPLAGTNSFRYPLLIKDSISSFMLKQSLVVRLWYLWYVQYLFWSLFSRTIRISLCLLSRSESWICVAAGFFDIIRGLEVLALYHACASLAYLLTSLFFSSSLLTFKGLDQLASLRWSTYLHYNTSVLYKPS